MHEADFAPDALSWLRRQHAALRHQIGASIREVQTDPKRHGVERLQGEYKGGPYYRYRSGGYRIVFRVDSGRVVIFVVVIGDRKEVYDLFKRKLR